MNKYVLYVNVEHKSKIDSEKYIEEMLAKFTKWLDIGEKIVGIPIKYGDTRLEKISADS